MLPSPDGLVILVLGLWVVLRQNTGRVAGKTFKGSLNSAGDIKGICSF